MGDSSKPEDAVEERVSEPKVEEAEKISVDPTIQKVAPLEAYFSAAEPAKAPERDPALTMFLMSGVLLVLVGIIYYTTRRPEIVEELYVPHYDIENPPPQLEAPTTSEKVRGSLPGPLKFAGKYRNMEADKVNLVQPWRQTVEYE